MSVNKTYGEKMTKAVAGLIENSDYNKATNHIVFNPEKLEMPEGVTAESAKVHVDWINDLSAQAEQATAEIAREQYASNDKLTTIDGTLNLGSFSVQTQHHLKQQIGEEFIYGQSTTAVDYNHSVEQAEWLDTQRGANQELAAKLFG